MSNFPPGSKVVVQGLKKASSVGVNLNGLVGNVQGPGTKAGRLAVEIREKMYSLKEQNIVVTPNAKSSGLRKSKNFQNFSSVTINNSHNCCICCFNCRRKTLL